MNYKKIINILSCFLISTLIIDTAFSGSALAAAEGNIHISVACDPGQLSVGDTFTVNLSVSEMTVSSFTGNIKYDDSLVEYVSFSGSSGSDDKKVFLLDEDSQKHYLIVGANTEDPYFGFAMAGVADQNYKENEQFLEITFRAISPGNPQFIISEDSDGSDGVMDSYKFDSGIEIADDGSASDEKEAVSLTIVHAPEKTDYSAGDYFDRSGMVVSVTYSDGSTEIVDNYNVFDRTLTSSDTEIVISYHGCKIAQEISVSESDDYLYDLIIDEKESETLESSGEEKGNGNSLIIIVLIAVLIVIIMALTAIVIYYKKKKH